MSGYRGLRFTGVFLAPLFAVYFSILAVNALADAPSKKNRPVIGLVLAGGGALGFAHVGVLQVLEENRIPVDIITGTSMGAIVGAAYASGVGLDEMRAVLSDTDWEDLFSESVPRSGIPYRFKPGREREIFGDTKISFKDGSLILPSGVVGGQKVLPLLQRLYG
jgi:NTE family protein